MMTRTRLITYIWSIAFCAGSFTVSVGRAVPRARARVARSLTRTAGAASLSAPGTGAGLPGTLALLI